MMFKKALVAITMVMLLVSLTTATEMQNEAQIQELLANGKFRKASKLLAKEVKANPGNHRAYVMLGDCYWSMQKGKKAAEAYMQALALDANDLETAFKLGQTFEYIEAYPDAIEAYKLVVEKQPDNALAHYHLGVSYDEIARLDDAFKQYKILQKLDPKLADKLYNILFLR